MQEEFAEFTAYNDQVVLGIDLGTTNSGVSVWNPETQKAEMLLDSEGKTLTPSVVGWDRQSEQWIIGQAAEEMAQIVPQSVQCNGLRWLGVRTVPFL